MAFVNGGAVVSCGDVIIDTAGSMLLGSSAGGGTVDNGPVRITANLVEPVALKTVRAVSPTRIRLEFTSAVLNNAALADVRNYAILAMNGAASVSIQSVDVPESTLALSVDLIVSEMTKSLAVSNYLLSINSDTIALGPELVADGNMEAVGVVNWSNAYNVGSLSKVAGSPSGSGAQVGRIAGTGVGFKGVFQSGLMNINGAYRVSAWMRSVNGDGKPFISYGSPAVSSDCIFYGGISTTYAFQQVDFVVPNTANYDRIIIGRDTALGIAVQADADELSLKQWMGTGGGPLSVADAEGTTVVTDAFPFTGNGSLPEILVAYATDKNTIVVQFSEAVLDLGSIRTVGAYASNLGLTITSVLSVDASSVTLKTSDQTPGQLYTLTLTGTWYDIALNQMTSPTATPVLGFVTPAAVEALLTLKMYNFLIEGLRAQDQTDEAAKFLERFVQGPQTIWASIVQTIFDIPKLWSASEAPDSTLQYLKRIVGWTPDLDPITNALDFATLRRLIAASVRFWKTRGPESSIEDLLRITTTARSYVVNWFAQRFILDITYAGESHVGGEDPWLLSVPGEGYPDAWTYNIRIVDDGSLDHQVVREIAKLTRPTGERVLITYLGFLDRFENDGDDTQWAFNSTPDVTREVSGGVMKFSQSGSIQSPIGFVKVDDNQDWSNYVVSWTLTSTIEVLYLYFYAVGDVTDPESVVDHYRIQLQFSTFANPNRILLIKSVGGSETTLANIQTATAFNEPLAPGVRYTFRAEVQPNVLGGTQNSIKIWWDDLLVIEHLVDTSFTQGSVGIAAFPQGNTTELSVHEVEMMFMPIDYDFIDLGGVLNNNDDGPFDETFDETFD